MTYSHRAVLLLLLSSTSAVDSFSLVPTSPSASVISSSLYSTIEAASTTGTKESPEIIVNGYNEKIVEEVPSVLLSPGIREDELFECDYSVQYWKDFRSEGNDGNLQRMLQVLQEEANKDNQARAYWASHLLRTGYFTANAALGTAFSDLHERFISPRSSSESKNERNAMAKEDQAAGSSPFFSNNAAMFTRLASSDIPTRLLLEAFRVYYQDYQHVKNGLLKFPWDALVRQNGIQWNHRQANPIFALQETARTISESVAIFSRRNQQKSKGVPFSQPTKSGGLYPDYYLNDFHYQTDGWMTSESAARYEASTETLFLGRQDAMQRQTLIPLLQSGQSPESILEVACGTGRFGTFTRDNFPTAEMTYTDLSPFYLEKAQENDKYWISQRGEDAMAEAGSSEIMPEPANFVQANAENLPFEDNSFDAVNCVYLFHELPKEAQQNVAKELVRVVKPGGMIVFSDSFQRGDRPDLDSTLGNFSKLNEPHYQNYIDTFLPDLFEGCEIDKKFMSSSTKTLSFVKKSESSEGQDFQ